MGKTGDGGVLPRGGGVWSPRPTSAVKLCPLRPSPGNSAACTARDVEEKVRIGPTGQERLVWTTPSPTKAEFWITKNHGAALCSRAWLPLRSNGYSVAIFNSCSASHGYVLRGFSGRKGWLYLR